MKFTHTHIPGVVVVDIEPLEDERGFFARSFCAEEFADQGLTTRFVQTNIAFNAGRGTLRGLHYQAAPKPEPKLVRCSRGALFDVAVDLRPESPAYGCWTGHELSAANRRALHIPEGCAHGLLTLEDDTEAFYLMGAAYDPACARGVRWNDPAFAIEWPFAPLVISERDAAYPDFAL